MPHPGELVAVVAEDLCAYASVRKVPPGKRCASRWHDEPRCARSVVWGRRFCNRFQEMTDLFQETTDLRSKDVTVCDGSGRHTR